MAYGRNSGRPSAGAVDAATRMNAMRARKRGLERRACADPVRRRRLERDPAAWLRWYMPTAFPMPWSKGHRAMIAGALDAARAGAGVAVAAPRGEGKTAVMRGMALYLVASGKVRFPVMAGWTHRSASEAFRVWLRMLHQSERFCADYPEKTQPFEESTHTARLKGLTWRDTGAGCGAEVRSTDRVIVLPDSLGAIAAGSVQGDVKGLSVTLADGTILRPDLLLLDDCQDPKRARSPSFVLDVVQRIEREWFGLAGPVSRMTAMVACTVAAPGDVSEHFLARPDFRGVRIARIETWPTGWEDQGSPVRALWDRWNEERVAGLRKGDSGLAARKYYRKHKAELVAGMTVSWPARKDAGRRDPDAIYAAMWDYYHIGEAAFMSEHQNAPLAGGEAGIFDLPAAHVAARTNGLPRRHAPEAAAVLVGMADINADGIRWALASASNGRAIAIVDYGIHPGGGRPLIAAGESDTVAVMRGLSGLDAVLRGVVVLRGDEPMPLELMLVDAGGAWMQAVFDWLGVAGRQSNIPWLASRGWSSRSYRPGRNCIGKPGDGLYEARWPGKGRLLVHDADLWRMRQQRGWLLPVGAPESMALFGAAGERHEVFADGVVAERLTNYAETEMGALYKWTMAPGARNDWGDVATGLCVAASRRGVGPSGTEVRMARPKANVIVRRTKMGAW